MPRELTKKHRNRVWKDSCGDIWFFSEPHGNWLSLLASLEGYNVETRLLPTQFDGPYKEIARNRVFGLA
jgi:hypothetical protein